MPVVAELIGFNVDLLVCETQFCFDGCLVRFSAPLVGQNPIAREARSTRITR
jgi:hypothetical protein